MTDQWYAKIMGEEFGPMSSQELKQLAVQKRITPDDLIRKSASDKWTSADRVKGLFSVQAATPTPSVAVSPESKQPTVAPNPAPKPAAGFEIIHGGTDRPNRVIGPVTARVGAATVLSPAPTIEEVNFKLQETALALGANAVIHVEYDRRFSMSSWKPLQARGTAIILVSDEIPCPTCAELVKVQAAKCRFCGEALPETSKTAQLSSLQSFVTKQLSQQRSTFWTWTQYIVGCYLGIGGCLVGIADKNSGLFFTALVFGLVVIPYTWDYFYEWSGMGEDHATRNRWITLVAGLMLANTISSAIAESYKSRPLPRRESSSRSAQKWYEGGTLHDRTALDWQRATSRDKLATCADLVASVPEITRSISGIDDLKPYAQKLVAFIDDAYARHPDPHTNRKMFTNQTVTSAAAIAFISWGWNPD